MIHIDSQERIWLRIRPSIAYPETEAIVTILSHDEMIGQLAVPIGQAKSLLHDLKNAGLLSQDSDVSAIAKFPHETKVKNKGVTTL